MSKITNLIGTTWRLGDKPFTGVVGSYGDFSIIGDGSISLSAGEEGVTYTGVITEFKCGFGNNDDMVALGTEIDGLPTIIIGDTGDYIAVLTITITGGEDISNPLFIDFINTYGTLVSGGEPPTAESVKSKLQSLITASNAKTGKSDANLTDAVNTLLEGYGQGGGGVSVTGLRKFNDTITVDGLTPIPFASQEELFAYLSNPPSIKCNFVNWGGLGYAYLKCNFVPLYATLGGETQFMALFQEDGKPGNTGFGDLIPTLNLNQYILDIEDCGQYEEWVLANTEEEDTPHSWPVGVATEAEMNELKETAYLGSIYEYLGETTDTYEKYGLYIKTESDYNGETTKKFSKMVREDKIETVEEYDGTITVE